MACMEKRIKYDNMIKYRIIDRSKWRELYDKDWWSCIMAWTCLDLQLKTGLISNRWFRKKRAVRFRHRQQRQPPAFGRDVQRRASAPAATQCVVLRGTQRFFPWVAGQRLAACPSGRQEDTRQLLHGVSEGMPKLVYDVFWNWRLPCIAMLHFHHSKPAASKLDIFL